MNLRLMKCMVWMSLFQPVKDRLELYTFFILLKITDQCTADTYDDMQVCPLCGYLNVNEVSLQGPSDVFAVHLF